MEQILLNYNCRIVTVLWLNNSERYGQSGKTGNI
jgi:hypothetical protein